jgi:hypothetical protein
MSEQAMSTIRAALLDTARSNPRPSKEYTLMGHPVVLAAMPSGDRWRVSGEGTDDAGRGVPQKMFPLLIALGVRDPATGKLVWNANDAEHMAEINELDGKDTEPLVNELLDLNGMSKKGEEAVKNA